MYEGLRETWDPNVLKLYTPPKKCLRGGFGKLPGKNRYLLNRSFERYSKTEMGKRTQETLLKAMKTGKIGFFQNFTFYRMTGG